MSWRYYDFYCATCDCVFEDLVQKDATTTACVVCTESDPEKVTKQLSAPSIVTLNDHSQLRKTLARRSFENSVKEAKANPEKLARSLGGTPKVQNKWNLRDKK